jgi:predicted nucleic acid-binding Zn ribbon protein
MSTGVTSTEAKGERVVMHTVCTICSNKLDEGETVKLRASIERGTPSIVVSEGQTVHVDCRKKHINTKPNRVPGKKKRISEPALRSQEPDFCFKDNCFFCGKEIALDTKHDSEDVYPVRTFNFQRTILSACDARGDEWAETVRDRINFARDLPAADAIYHKQCSSNFHIHRRIPSKYCDSENSEPPRKGRKIDASREEAFLLAIEDLVCGNDDEQTTVVDFLIFYLNIYLLIQYHNYKTYKNSG